MRLAYFTEGAFERLFHDVEANKPRYRSELNWLDDYFSEHGDYYKKSSVSVGDFTPYSISDAPLRDEEKSQEDLVNVTRLHSAFKSLTPWQASNKYMWTYMCHADLDCRRYIQRRWLVKEGANTIRERFFVTSSNSLLNDNALSRLWWYGHLTYDEASTGDPYWLTRVLLTNQTIASDIMDTFTASNPTRAKGVLMAIDEYAKAHTTKGLVGVVREANKSLNRYAAVTVVELLSCEEMRDVYLGFMRAASGK